MDKDLTNSAKRPFYDNFLLEEAYGRHRVRLETGSFCHFAPGTTNGRHSHSYYEVCLVLSGQGNFHHGENRFRVKRGDIFIADPHTVHEISTHTGEKLDLVFLTILIEQQTRNVTDQEEDSLLARFLKGHRLVAAGGPHLADYLRLLDPGPETPPGSGYYLRRNFLTFAFELIGALAGEGAAGDSKPELHSSVINRAVRYIQAHAQEKISVENIASHAGVSERTLRRLFRRHLDKTVVDEIREQRAGKAARLLLMHLSVNEVADKLKMEHPGELTRLFKQQFGTTPSEYQRTHSPRQLVMQTQYAVKL